MDLEGRNYNSAHNQAFQEISFKTMLISHLLLPSSPECLGSRAIATNLELE